jgi:hypothetical protein
MYMALLSRVKEAYEPSSWAKWHEAYLVYFTENVNWVPIHQGMSCPQVADEGDSL